MADKPNCYECIHRCDVPGDAHSQCNNKNAQVTASKHGVRRGWFMWPINFDPVWLVTCDGFSTNPKDRLPPMDFSDMFKILLKFFE
jgi:hypothetical protein